MQIYQSPDGQYVDSEGNAIDQGTVDAYAEADRTGAWGAALSGTMNAGRNVLENVGVMDESPAWERRISAMEDVHPYATFAGQMIPESTPLGKGKLLTQAAKSGGVGWATGDPNTNPVLRTATGVLGEVAGDMAGRIFRRVKSVFSEGDETAGQFIQPLAEQAEQQGYKTTPGMRSGLRSDYSSDRQFATTGGSSEVMEGVVEHNKDQSAQKVMAAMGIDSGGRTRITPSVLKEAEKQWQKEYSQVSGSIPDITLSEEASDQLRDVAKLGSREITPQVRRVWKNQTGIDLPDEGPITLNGGALIRARTAASKATTNSNMNISNDAGDMVDQLDKLVQTEAGENVAAKYEKAREKYFIWQHMDGLTNRSTGGRVYDANLARRLESWEPKTNEMLDLKQSMLSMAELRAPFGDSGSPDALNPKGQLKSAANKKLAQAHNKYGGRVPYVQGLLDGQSPDFGIPGGLARGGLLTQQDRPNVPPVGDYKRIR